VIRRTNTNLSEININCNSPHSTQRLLHRLITWFDVCYLVVRAGRVIENKRTYVKNSVANNFLRTDDERFVQNFNRISTPQVRNKVSKCLLCTSFGARVVCGRPSPRTLHRGPHHFAVNVALLAQAICTLREAVSCTQEFISKHEVGQAASTILHVFGVSRPGFEPSTCQQQWNVLKHGATSGARWLFSSSGTREASGS